jgi:nitronate monooxygenase
MTLRTGFTELLSIEHPIALAPMSGCAGGALAAAVCNAGGLGLIGGGREGLDWCVEQVQLMLRHTERPWGIGFLTWALERATLGQVLKFGPAAVMLSFGDPGPFAAEIRRAGAKLIVQVTDLDEARQALDVGADVVVAQGAEAGGHGGRRATLPFVPAVVDLAMPTPVLAAGGIADGRGLAAALVLGAAGALIGTRFEVTP